MKQRLPLVMLGLVFILPFIFGKLAYSGIGPELGTVNHGELIENRHLSDLLGDKRAQEILTANKSIYLIFLKPDHCTDTCRLTETWVDDAYRAVHADAPLIGKFIQPASSNNPFAENVYLVDRAGRLILKYSPVSTQQEFLLNGDGLLADIKRLLKGVRA